MFSRFFIHRPIFAMVISIIIVIAGAISIKGLGVEEYPNLTSPVISVKAYYKGVDAATLSQTVASPLEDAINGVENMIYMQSSASSDGSTMIQVYFKVGSDSDKAMIDVNNRVQTVMAKLPEDVKRLGVTVESSSSNILEVVSIYSPDGSQDSVFLNNYTNMNIADELRRIEGVGSVQVIAGKEYSMRVWIDPNKLNKYNITANEVTAAIREQNKEYPTGDIGSLPSSANNTSPYVYSITAKGKLSTVDDFKNIILRANKDGNILYLKDVARIEIDGESYGVSGSLNGKQMIPILINLQNGANALEVVSLVNDKLEELSKNFPSGVAFDVPYDTTDFVRTSVMEVVHTFVEAVVLVLVVMYFFLKNFRATLIPLIAVPVSIVGTFAVLYIVGFSINLITLFALVLAIGLVVDDAIIVVENVERIFKTNKDITDAKVATEIAMKEITGPVISIVLVLSAVFIPVSFLDGFVGQIQRQFALTLVISVCISGFVALTLTPALCGMFLTNHEPKPFWLVEKFNQFFDWCTNFFTDSVAKILRHIIPSIIIVACFMWGIFGFLKIIPSSLVPEEDKGAIISLSQLQSGSNLNLTDEFNNKIYNVVSKNPAIDKVVSIAGFDAESSALKSNSSISFITLKPYEQRKHLGSSKEIADNYFKNFIFDKDGFAFFFTPPPIMGLSLTGGFEMYVQNKSGKSYFEINEDINKLVQAASSRPELTQVRNTLTTDSPDLKMEVNEYKAKMLGLDMASIYTALNSVMGTVYVNDFTALGKNFKVNVRGDYEYRSVQNALNNIFVKNAKGENIALASVVELKHSVTSPVVMRFNQFPAAKVTGAPAEGYSSGDALKAIVEVFEQTMDKNEYSYAWAGSSYEEVNSSGSGTMAFVFGMVFVYLILAAQYERWLMPLAVITAVPFAVFGSLLATYLRGMNNDIYFQIGLILLIGLSAKNAILIIEFAMEARIKEGLSIFDSSIQAIKLRFRPIIMTSLAFGFGILPLVLSTGPGSGARHALGTGLIGGIVFASTISILFVPLFFYLLEKLNEKIKGKKNV